MVPSCGCGVVASWRVPSSAVFFGVQGGTDIGMVKCLCAEHKRWLALVLPMSQRIRDDSLSLSSSKNRLPVLPTVHQSRYNPAFSYCCAIGIEFKDIRRNSVIGRPPSRFMRESWNSPHERKNCFKAAPIGLCRLFSLVYLTISPNFPI